MNLESHSSGIITEIKNKIAWGIFTEGISIGKTIRMPIIYNRTDTGDSFKVQVGNEIHYYDEPDGEGYLVIQESVIAYIAIEQTQEGQEIVGIEIMKKVN